MMCERVRVGAYVSLAVVVLSGRPIAAQTATVTHEGADRPDRTATWVGVPAGPVGDFDVIATSPGSEAVVKNAPYSADAVSEMVQTLGDGTRIVRKSTAAVYRDTAGRTRREHGLTVIGPLATSPDAEDRIITISDPDARVTYMLNPRTRTARKVTGSRLVVSDVADRTRPGGPPRALPHRTELRSAAGAPGEFQLFVRNGYAGSGASDSATESLGTQLIEGVAAEGTRTTLTIPAGQIGNDRPIQVVSERWYSSDLHVLVMSKQSDPRFGETTYRLTNIVLGEPLYTLFEVPADYEVIEGPGPDAFYRELRP